VSNILGEATTVCVLGEGAILERLRRAGTRLDGEVANAGLLFETEGRAALSAVVQEYLRIAEEARLPFLVTTPTWRAQADRVARSGLRGRALNAEGARFARGIVRDATVPVEVAGLMGPRGDCYRPLEAPDADAARVYHRAQAAELAAAGVDWILAATLPSLEEARGIVSLSAEVGVPVVASFVLDPEGRLLDGHSLSTALERLDAPVLLNCTHWSFARRALREVPCSMRGQVRGLQANTAACHPADLDGAQQLVSEAPEVFAEGMAALRRDFGVRLLGGCCGTGPEHLRALAGLLTAP
jgi:homocysteine S-methyltransferase